MPWTRAINADAINQQVAFDNSVIVVYSSTDDED